MMNVVSFLFGHSTPSLVFSNTFTLILLMAFIETIIRRIIFNRKIEEIKKSLCEHEIAFDDIVQEPVCLFGDNKKYYKSLIIRFVSEKAIASNPLFKNPTIPYNLNEKNRLDELAELLSRLSCKKLKLCVATVMVYCYGLHFDFVSENYSDINIINVLSEIIEEMNSRFLGNLSLEQLCIYKYGYLLTITLRKIYEDKTK